MPIYEYKCPSCNQRFEVMQRIADPPLDTCETCGGPLEKLISAPSFQFKGSGWYVTDYGKGGGNKSDSNSKAEGGDGSKKSEEKTETKKESGTSESSKKSDT